MIKLYREILFSIIRLLFSLLSLNFLIMEIILKIFIPVYSVYLLIDKVLILNILNSKTLIKDSINLLLYVILSYVSLELCKFLKERGADKVMYKSEKRSEEVESSNLKLSEIIPILVYIMMMFIMKSVMLEILVKFNVPNELMEILQIGSIIFNIFLVIFVALAIITFIFEVIPDKSKNEKSKDWNVEILEIKSKYKNDKISYKKALKMIKKIKKKKEKVKNEVLLKEERIKILDKESLMLSEKQEKSVWIE